MAEHHRVLIVEDDPATAEDLGLVLDGLEFTHEVVDNRDDALQRFESQDFCLVLLDLQIKFAAGSVKGHAEAGRELLRRMRALSPKNAASAVPIVVVSGHAKEADEAVEAMRDGADDVVQKPIKSRLLPDRIRLALQTSGERAP